MSRKPDYYVRAAAILAANSERLPDGCLLWTGPQGGGHPGDRYGLFRFDGPKTYAHRLAWEVEHEQPVPAGKVVDHAECGRKLCIEPSHLLAVSRHDNDINRRKLDCRNLTGWRGVGRTHNGKYRARIKDRQTDYYLGVYDTPEEAAVAAYRKRRELWPYLVDKSDPVEQLLANLRESIAARLGDATGVEAIRIAEQAGRLHPWATPVDIVEALQSLTEER